MLFYEMNVDVDVYKLRLATRNIVALEKKLGGSLLSIFDGDDLPQTEVLVTIMHEALQNFQHGINLDKTYDIIDKWLEEGNSYTDLVFVIFDVFKVSGIIPSNVDVDKLKKKAKATAEGKTEKN